MIALLFLLGASTALAQSAFCPGATAWTPCDLAFDLTPAEDSAGFELHGEFRSPHHKTYGLRAFREGDHHYILRFTPTEGGDWEYRLSSSVARFNGEEGRIRAAPSGDPGFIHVASLHHFQAENGKAHLWMGSSIDNFAQMARAEFDQAVEDRARGKFTHVRVTIDAHTDLREAADRIRAINTHGMVADLVLAAIPPGASGDDAQARRKYIADLAARFSAMNITWMGAPAFEKLAHGRAVLKATGALLQQYDGYDHPRSSMAEGSSAALASDNWISYACYGTVDPNVGAVEHQLYGMPGINTAIQSQRDLWNATMNGQYPGSGSGPYMAAWFDFMSGTRYWELEPYFDVDGGRALALEGIEYIVYVEKPGPVEVTLVNHGYDVAWINPATGERIKAKDYKGEHFTGEPPDKSHDWVLHISRESKKASMLKSYFWDSRGYEDREAAPIQLQALDTPPEKVPFEVSAPAEGSNVSIAMPPLFSLKVTRPARATRSLLVEWTGEVTADGEGYRIIGTGREGTFHIPEGLAHHLPAALRVRVSVLNANGKAYEIDKVYSLTT